MHHTAEEAKEDDVLNHTSTPPHHYQEAEEAKEADALNYAFSHLEKQMHHTAEEAKEDEEQNHYT